MQLLYISSLITFSQQLKHWTISILNAVPLKSKLPPSLETRVSSRLSSLESMVLSPKAKVSSRERVEQLLVSKGLWNVYGLKDEINSVFCFSNHDALGQFHMRQWNFEFFKIKFCTMKLNQQKAETMGCLKLLRSCASCPCA